MTVAFGIDSKNVGCIVTRNSVWQHVENEKLKFFMFLAASMQSFLIWALYMHPDSQYQLFSLFFKQICMGDWSDTPISIIFVMVLILLSTLLFCWSLQRRKILKALKKEKSVDCKMGSADFTHLYIYLIVLYNFMRKKSFIFMDNYEKQVCTSKFSSVIFYTLIEKYRNV